MSLIERAAGKIPGRKPDEESKPEADQAEKRPSTIEALMERTAQAREAEAPQARAAEPAAPPPVPPASAAPPPPPGDTAPPVSPGAAEQRPAPGAAPSAAPPAPGDRGVERTEPFVAPLAARPAAARPVSSPAPAATCAPAVRIHLEALRARGYVTPEGEQQRLGQEFRVIKRPLLENAFGHAAASVRNGRRVMVTSAFPSEGKTFCAINLAMSIAAERDCQVLLVDADVARPALLRELGISASAGLMDCLIDGTPDVTSLVLPTNVEKLSILPPGRRHGQSTELLASDAMTDILDRLSTSYPDCILLFDSPPLLLTTEARVLAGHMGQIVLVVEAMRTPQDGVREALATVQHCDVVGLVLNKARTRAKGYYSGYDSGYGGYGYASAA